MHGSRKEKRSLCMYVCSFNIQLAFNLSVVTHKTVHTSEHNDWLWKTVRYMVQPYKIKSYSRAQHAQHLIPLRFWFNTPYASAVWKECGPNVYTFVFMCVKILLLSFHVALHWQIIFRSCCSRGICSGSLADVVFRRPIPYFIHSNQNFPSFRWVLLVHLSLPTSSSSAGMVEKWTSEWMNGWMVERMNVRKSGNECVSFDSNAIRYNKHVTRDMIQF